MRTNLKCIPCFFKQALEAARISGADDIVQKMILDDVARAVPGFPLDCSPPEMGKIIHDLVKKHTGIEDPYAKIKERSNRLAAGIHEQVKKKIERSSDRLLTAVELAIAGNIIDYGVKNSLNVESELEKILKDERKNIEREDSRFFEYARFLRDLDRAKSILYLADNAGETVFDRVLIEEIRRRDKDKDIWYAVKEKPIINDALAEDAVICGVDKVAKVISSGSGAPGTVLSACSKDLLGKFEQADMVISKGQGNFEALSGAKRRIFFLLIAKCDVVAKDVGCGVGDILLMCDHAWEQGRDGENGRA
jgi:damage-control phosphatase, subfamily I